MTAFVLGATGFVGREVVRQLCVRATPVVAHVRPDSPKLAEWRARFAELGAEVDASPWDPGALAAALRASRAAQLYVLIGTTRAKAKADGVATTGASPRPAGQARRVPTPDGSLRSPGGNIYEQVDLRLTRLAVDAARGAETRPRIIFLSSVGADPTARSAYLRARGEAEAAVRDAGLPWVIARPSFIVGDRDESRRGERVAAAMTDGLLAVAGVLGGRRLRDTYRSTHPDILASALIRLAEADDHDRVASGAELH